MKSCCSIDSGVGAIVSGWNELRATEAHLWGTATWSENGLVSAISVSLERNVNIRNAHEIVTSKGFAPFGVSNLDSQEGISLQILKLKPYE